MRLLTPLVTALLCAGLAACSSQAATDTATSPAPAGSAPTVVAAAYPAQFLLDRVGGDLVRTETLAAPGTEPHDVELTGQQIAEVQDAAALFYFAGFQPAVDDAAAQLDGTAVDLVESSRTIETPDGAIDPHVWLDPTNMSSMADAVAGRLAEIAPDHADRFQSNAATLKGELADLDRRWSEGTAECRNRTLVVSHDAFGYLADRYRFQQKGISGLTPENEPSAQAIADLTTFVQDNGTTTVYSETLVDPKVAETIAAEAGVDTAVLDPIEGLAGEGDGTYLTLMADNLVVVRKGQGCR